MKPKWAEKEKRQPKNEKKKQLQNFIIANHNKKSYISLEDQFKHAILHRLMQKTNWKVDFHERYWDGLSAFC